jgi:arylformamidase
MRKLVIALGLTLGLAIMAGAGAVSEARERGQAPGGATLIVGAADKQRVDLYRPVSGGQGQPLILYVHGGGWRMGSHKHVAEKPAWASRMGLWFGSIGYRYLPEAPVETQAADVGAAIRKARAEARRFGYDPNRIILMGHSAGAHLAALVATDPKYAGEAFAAIKAVIPIDGAGYDVPTQMADAPFMTKRIYAPAFGTDPVRQRALSPMTHAGGRDAPRWLIIHVDSRDDSRNQSRAFATALRNSGAQVTVKGIPGTHMTANQDFGKADYPAQAEVDALVRAVVG